ncbi:MAG: methylated-DNA--[protein]-cysteine S-methyltransferase [Proteobacteria bacterium]|nr:methylated-DNA--[protein]-cysteine S-methyltransferase [Pseudomonadota bacterium]
MDINQLFYHVFSSSFGEIVIVFKNDTFKLKTIYLPGSPSQAFIRSSGDKFLKDEKPSADVQATCQAIKKYFNGYAIDIPWKILDLSTMTDTQKGVLRATADIPYGEVRSYREIAISVGRPKACRFVGNTLAKNPFPVLIPCHRVIRSDHSFGQFGGGAELKKKMIQLEKNHQNRYQRNLK